MKKGLNKTEQKKHEKFFSCLLSLLILLFAFTSNSVAAVSEAYTGFQLPISDSYTYGYTFLEGPINYGCSGGSVYHPGVDLNVSGTNCDGDRGTNVYAVADGVVKDVGTSSGEWGTVVIEHNYNGTTVYSQYGHLDSILVSAGQTVTKGQHIGEMGDKEADCVHLHFEIRKSSHPNPTYAPAFCSILGGTSKTTVSSYYENPIQFVNSHPAYSTATGHASVSQLTVPSSVILGQNFNISFTLKEVNGASKKFENIAVAILKSDNTFVFDFAMFSNITISANGTWSQTATKYIYSTSSAGTYKAIVRGKVAGGNWFDFDVTGSGINPASFTAQSCSYSIFPTSNSSVSSSGGTGSVSVTATSGCSWTASSNASWITITSGSSGSGSGTVGYSVASNTSTSSRSGTVTIAEQTFTVTQAGLYLLSAPTLSAPSNWATGVSTTPTFSWSAVTGANRYWLMVTTNPSDFPTDPNATSCSGCVNTGLSGNTNTTSFTAGNTFPYGGTSRTLNPGTTYYWKVQAWNTNGTQGNYPNASSFTTAPSCSYSISPTSNSFSSSGGTGSVSVTATSGCSWTASSNASWITITSGSSGSGNGTVGYSVASNTSTSSRTGTLTIAGQTFTVAQSGISCNYSISPTSNSIGSSGGTGSVTITATSGCSWTASSSASWIIISPSSGSGSGTVSYSVSSNSSTSSRSGTLTIAGQSFTVTQTGISCSYSISPTSISVSSSGGTGSVSVTATSGCSWTATSNVSWISVTSGSSGIGNGTVTYSVSSNTSTSSRTGTMTIAGQTFTVTQSGVSCNYSISPSSNYVGSNGGTGSVAITATSGCSWTASSNASWITIISGSSGSGSGTVSYSVSSNSSTSSRSGTLTIAGQTFTVTQSGATSSNAQPSVTTSVASSVTTNAAVLNGTVNPNGLSTSAWFEYGTSTSYGYSTSSQSVGSGTNTVSISQSVSGLFPSTTYYYRVVAQNSLGTSYGSPQSFTTGGIQDTTPPTVSSTNPPSNATGVGVNSAITAAFSETINASSISGSTFYLKDSGNSLVSGSVTYSGTTAIFTPSYSLAFSTTYTATITTGVKDSAGNNMSSNYTWSFTTGGAPDTTPPSVNSTFPPNNATGVAVNAAITAMFSENMTSSTINTSAFTVSGVSGTVTYSGTTATFTPNASLAYNTTYTVTITTGVKDSAGNALASVYTWSFTTGPEPDTTAPTVSATNPSNGATGVSNNASITATFSENMDISTVNTSTFTLSTISGDIAGTVNYSENTATLTPSSSLEYETIYTAKISSNVKDSAGNKMASDFSWSFETGLAPDKTAPTVTSTVPSDEASDVPVNAVVSVTFSEDMDASSINTATLTVTKGGNGIAGTVSAAGNSATFIPLSNLDYGTVYIVIIKTSVKDLAGNKLASQYTWNFTTGDAPDTEPPSSPTVTGKTPSNDMTPTWEWSTGGGGNGTFRYKLDNTNLTIGAVETTSTSFTPASDLAAGQHTLHVQERDNAGNWSSSGSFTIEVVAAIYEQPNISLALYLAPGQEVKDIYAINDTVELIANFRDKNGEDIKLTFFADWVSSDPDVASVSEGHVTFVGNGKVKILAYMPGLMASMDFTVGGDELEKHYGNLIILAGGNQNDPGDKLKNAIQYLSGRMYQVFKARGFMDDDIYYINHIDTQDLDGDGVVDGIVDETDKSVSSLQDAITWAEEQPNDGPLYLYFVDHGEKNGTFLIDANQIIPATQLDAFLDDFENQTGRELVIIFEACYSGSFVNALTGTNPDRVIFTSSSSSQYSYLSDYGDVSFSQFLSSYFLVGYDWEESFDMAASDLKAMGMPFAKMSPQKSVGTLPGKIYGDFSMAGLFSKFKSYTQGGNVPTGIEQEFIVELEIMNVEGVEAWVLVTPPNYQPPSVTEEYTTPSLGLEKFELLSQKGTEKFFGNYTFPCNGIYKIVYYVKDKAGNVISSPPQTYEASGGDDCEYEGSKINLSSSWNLIALPVTPSVPYTAQDILDEIKAQGGDCVEIDRWNNGTWSGHIDGLPFNDFDIKIGEGYFLKCVSLSTWNLYGSPISSLDVQLLPGWNLIGVPKDNFSAQDVLDEIKAQGGDCVEIDRWNNGTWSGHIDGLPFNDFDIKIGQGYFLKCQTPSNYHITYLQPVMTNITNTGFTVSWVTDAEEAGEIRYGTDPDNITIIAYDDRGASGSDDTHHVTIGGLVSETVYYYDIVSGGVTYDNGGSHYSVTTGPTLALPASDTIYGKVYKSDGLTPAEGAIVYVTVTDNNGAGISGNSQVLSGLVDSEGWWNVNIGPIRTSDLSSYYTYSASGDSVVIDAQGAGDGGASQTVGTDSDTPAPEMLLIP